MMYELLHLTASCSFSRAAVVGSISAYVCKGKTDKYQPFITQECHHKLHEITKYHTTSLPSAHG